MSLDEIKVMKSKNGRWIAYDKDGHKVEGITKQHALNQFYALYRINKNTVQIKQPPIDMKEFKI